jgi:hypothetical protein
MNYLLWMISWIYPINWIKTHFLTYIQDYTEKARIIK